MTQEKTMLQKNKGIDIIRQIGGINDVTSAVRYFKQTMDDEHFSRLQKISNPEVLLKIANAIAMCNPDSIFINTGTEADRQFIRDLALKKARDIVKKGR